MVHKIFISYKYGDESVQHLSRTKLGERTKVRDYVDELQELFKEKGQINKGELDDEDLSQFKDTTIESKLRDKIYDSSVTIVLISPKMKDSSKPEDEQWIPWEVSYSLRETTRNDRTSRTNGLLAVVLPDFHGYYDYMLEKKTCCASNCRLWHTDKLFKVLNVNMFNQKKKNKIHCEIGDNVYSGFPSYIHMVRWDDFIKNINHWIEVAEGIRDDKDSYDIRVNID